MMRTYFLLLVLTCTSVFANDAEISEGVWIDGSSFYKSIKHKKKSTIYFSDWSGYVDQFLQDDDYYVAIQLDEYFDPLPSDQITLPTLATIGAIADKDLRNEYYAFLERFGRTSGVNHLVLPDTAGFTSLEKEVIQEANDYSPYYFLNKSSLSYAIPSSKKAFESELESEPTIWIAGQNDNTSKLNRWSNKLSSDIASSFYQELSKSKLEKFFPSYGLPKDLSNSIFVSSVIAIDPEKRLPLQENVITYLGMDVQLRNRLASYIKVLDYRAPGVACLVDRRDAEIDFRASDIVLQKGISEEIETAIVLPQITISHVDVVIAKMLFGATGMIGRSTHSKARRIENPKFLGYSDPEIEGLGTTELLRIDSIAASAIRKFATPGMQLAVIKNGSVVTERTYGFFTYDSMKAVSNETIYDIASVTKVIATLPAIALLIDQGKINLDDSLSMHLKEFGSSNKSTTTLRQLLSHNAGLKSYVPFWSMMLDGDRLDAFYYKTPEDEANDIRSYGIEPDPSMADSLKSYLVRSDLIETPDEYRYSDLGFMILHLLVEEVSGMSFEEFVTQNFYQPMGLSNTMFNPIRKGISPKQIAPTEYDNRFRNYQVWGEVHDRNAAVFGGIAGHAGLFSTATDLAKMMSMFLNNGFYGGKQYLSSTTIAQLNERYFDNNRRGLGWDKLGEEKNSASEKASGKSFGHTGFTGTMVWADPEADLIYIFLSNRIYPDANNWKLMELNIRTEIHDTLYESIENFELRN